MITASSEIRRFDLQPEPAVGVPVDTRHGAAPPSWPIPKRGVYEPKKQNRARADSCTADAACGETHHRSPGRHSGADVGRHTTRAVGLQGDVGHLLWRQDILHHGPRQQLHQLSAEVVVRWVGAIWLAPTQRVSVCSPRVSWLTWLVDRCVRRLCQPGLWCRAPRHRQALGVPPACDAMYPCTSCPGALASRRWLEHPGPRLLFTAGEAEGE